MEINRKFVLRFMSLVFLMLLIALARQENIKYREDKTEFLANVMREVKYNSRGPYVIYSKGRYYSVDKALVDRMKSLKEREREAFLRRELRSR